jgi:hypothetical protein
LPAVSLRECSRPFFHCLAIHEKHQMHVPWKVVEEKTESFADGLGADDIVSSALVIMTRPSGSVCKSRGGAASDDCRGFVDQLVDMSEPPEPAGELLLPF